MCALLNSNEAASAIPLDQRGADLALDAESYFAQIPNPNAGRTVSKEEEVQALPVEEAK